MPSVILQSLTEGIEDIVIKNLTNNKFTIGRSNHCSYQLNQDYISNRHVALSYEEGAFFIIDLESTNGTFMNNSRLGALNRVQIKDNDTVRLGSVKYKFKPTRKLVLMTDDSNNQLKNERVEGMFTEKVPKDVAKACEVQGKRNPFSTFNNIVSNQKNDVKSINKIKMDDLQCKLEHLQKEHNALIKKEEKLRKTFELSQFILDKRKNKISKLVTLANKNKIKIQRLKKLLKLANSKRKRMSVQLDKVNKELDKLKKEFNEMDLKFKNKCTLLCKTSDNPNDIRKEDEKMIKQSQSIEQIINEDLICCVCHEVFIEPYSINCGHTFCKYCLNEWAKKNDRKEDCPVCRKAIHRCQKVLVLSQIIEKLVQTQDAETLDFRKQMSEARDNQAANYSAIEKLCKRSQNDARMPYEHVFHDWGDDEEDYNVFEFGSEFGSENSTGSVWLFNGIPSGGSRSSIIDTSDEEEYIEGDDEIDEEDDDLEDEDDIDEEDDNPFFGDTEYYEDDESNITYNDMDGDPHEDYF